MVAQLFALLGESLARFSRHDLLLPHDFAFDFVFQVKSSEVRDCDELVVECPVEEFGSFLQRIACPLVKSILVGEEVDVLLVQMALNLDSLLPLLAFEYYVSANVLHLVVG